MVTHPATISISREKQNPMLDKPYRLDGTHVTPNTPDFRDTRQARDWARKAGVGPQGDSVVEVSLLPACHEPLSPKLLALMFVASQKLYLIEISPSLGLISFFI